MPGANEGVPNSLASGTRPDDRRQTSAISINGALDNQNNQLLDGIDNNERFIGTMVVKPSIDAIAEVKVQTNMYTAEVGRTAGGVVNIITKSGINDFHGSAFEFNRNDKFDARELLRPTSRSRSSIRTSSAAASAVRCSKNRTFFFADYEGFQQTQGVTYVITVPTAKMRAGDFSELSAPIYDPTTTPRTPFPGNVIPAGPARSDRAEATWRSTRCRTRRRAGEQLHRQRRIGRRTAARPTSASITGSTTATAVRALFLQQRRHVHARRAADRQRHRAGRQQRARSPGRTRPRAHGVQANYLRDLRPDAGVRSQGAATCTATSSRCRSTTARTSATQFGLPERQHRRGDVGADADEPGRLRQPRRRDVHPADHGQQDVADQRLGDQDARRAQPQDRRRPDRAPVPSVPERVAGRHAMTFTTALTDNGAGSAATASPRSCSGIRRRWRGRIRLFDPHYRTTEPNVVRAGRLARDLVADAQRRRALRRLHAADRRGRTTSRTSTCRR